MQELIEAANAEVQQLQNQLITLQAELSPLKQQQVEEAQQLQAQAEVRIFALVIQQSMVLNVTAKLPGLLWVLYPIMHCCSPDQNIHTNLTLHVVVACITQHDKLTPVAAI